MYLLGTIFFLLPFVLKLHLTILVGIIVCTFFSAQHYIHLQDRRTVFYCMCCYVNKFQKRNQPVENMGKNIKSYATTQIHSLQEGREALWQIIQIFHLQM